jgi:hypothetical protein
MDLYIIIETMETETMATCVNHADESAGLVCMKYQIHFCEQCARCRDPKLFCKHRTACIIWFNTKLCGLTGTAAAGESSNDSRFKNP